MGLGDAYENPQLGVVVAKKCSFCHAVKPLEDFGKRNGVRNGHKSACRQCLRERARDAYVPLRDYVIYDENKDLKRCSLCEEMLPRESFTTAASRPSKHGLQSQCIQCKKDRYDADAAHSATLTRLYGISEDQYLLMVQMQEGLCACCGEHPGFRKDGTPKRLQVDHNHETGAVRALLCNKCNAGLGFFDEQVDRLLSAIEYLRRF